MLKNLKLLVSSSVVYPRKLNSSCLILSLVRLTHNGEDSKGAIYQDDKEEAKEQFSNSIPVGSINANITYDIGGQVWWKTLFRGCLYEHLKIKYSRSPGPGGQNVNKVNTKVDLRFHVMTAQWIPYWIREKLQEKEGNRINKEGELVVQSNRFRSQPKNLEDGLQKLTEILEEVSYIPKETSEEKKTKILEMIKTDNQRRLQEKRFRSQRKQERSRNE